MVLIGLTLGVLAGMKEGSTQDRAISVFSIITTSIPEYASAVFLVRDLRYSGWAGCREPRR